MKSSSSPTPPTRPRSCGRFPPRRPGGCDGREPAPRLRDPRGSGPRQRRGADGGGLPGRARLHVVRRGRACRHGPSIVCRTGYTGERGYELVVPNAAAVSVWDALMAAGSQLRHRPGRPRRARHAAHRDGLPVARPGHLAWPSRRCRRGSGGRSAGTRTLLGCRRACAPNGRPNRPSCCAASSPTGAASRDRTCGSRKDGERRRRDHLRDVLADAGARASAWLCWTRRVVDGDTVTVDVRGRSEAFTVTKPPFVTPGVRQA